MAEIMHGMQSAGTCAADLGTLPAKNLWLQCKIKCFQRKDCSRLSLAIAREANAMVAAPCLTAGDHSSAQKDRICVVWFKRDLRMDDHPGLTAAISSEYSAIVPLFIFDPVLFQGGWSKNLFGSLVNAVADLRLALQNVGSDLIIRNGSAEDVLLGLTNQVSVTDVFTEEEIEIHLKNLVSKAGNKLLNKCTLRTWKLSLYPKQDPQKLPDDYKSYQSLHQFLISPIDAPSYLPPLPSGVLPSSKEHNTDIVLTQQTSTTSEVFSVIRKETARCRLLRLLRKASSATATRPGRLNSWFSRMNKRSSKLLSSQSKHHLSAGATEMLDILKGYLMFSEPVERKDWRMLHQRVRHFKETSGHSFRPIFEEALNLGTLSPRRVYYEALMHQRTRWFSSTASAAMEEIKLIEWYKFLSVKSSKQGLNGKIWKWRGFLIEYTSYGEEGPAVLLVHGFGAFWQHFRDNIKDLGSKGNRVWAVTMLGFGRSEKPTIVYSELLWAELLRDFIIEVIQEPAVIVGNSLGGYIATLVAGLWPPLARSLVLLNPAGVVVPNCEETVVYPSGRQKTGIPRSTSQLLLFFLQRHCVSVFKRCYPTNEERVDKWIVDEVMRASYDPGATAVLESMFYLRLPLPLNYLLDQYNGKVMMIQGIHDPLQDASKKARQLTACCKEVTVKLVNAGHCPHDEVPDEVNKLIGEWLTSTIR